MQRLPHACLYGLRVGSGAGSWVPLTVAGGLRARRAHWLFGALQTFCYAEVSTIAYHRHCVLKSSVGRMSRISSSHLQALVSWMFAPVLPVECIRHERSRTDSAGAWHLCLPLHNCCLCDSEAGQRGTTPGRRLPTALQRESSMPHAPSDYSQSRLLLVAGHLQMFFGTSPS